MQMRQGNTYRPQNAPVPRFPQRIPWERSGLYFPINTGQRAYPPNAYNQVLDIEAGLWRDIQRCGGMDVIARCPATRYTEPPWIRQPMLGKRFSKIGSVSLGSLVAGVDTVVESFIVPVGFDGVIVSTVNEYTGSGFVEGSGDITWRIKLNNRYVKDYGNIQTTIGSLTTPYSINSGGIRLQSRQLVQYIVNVSAGGMGNLNGGRIICGLFGWFYPR